MNWIRGKTIGRGSSATVSIATASRSGDVLAVKSAELSQSQFLNREQEILAGLSSPYVIAYKGCCITSENGTVLYNLCLEYAPGGSISDAVRKHGGCLREDMIRNYVHKILLGLDYLHGNRIVHCDIKGPNVLLTSDGVKIADLGCARHVDEVSGEDRSTVTPLAGTPAYMAPEVARGEQQGFPADIWALGCTVIEMATGRAPWVGVLDPVLALYRIGFSGDVPEIPTFLSEQAKDFLSKCLKREPKERWSASELLNHAFLVETESASEEMMSTFNMVTPTSVLDQQYWESEDELDTTWNPTQKRSSNSPMDRIKKLSELSSKIPNWSLDKTWVTVRNNGSKEADLCPNSQYHEDNLQLQNKDAIDENLGETDKFTTGIQSEMIYTGTDIE
ncbi:hypothetical protein HS088_TW21G00723 [Tripterygium wilfordii]|uniref:Protein kinase domain-containing protein n=1 Tax=Tripterygium wilfordii TaxID=458696 RepID=A0A7J7C3R5_TRIWF|nr:hypothetical protein HS088_TW21G00723 [Tripterygium wilfordii]